MMLKKIDFKKATFVFMALLYSAPVLPATCGVSSAGINFGSYSPFVGVNTDSTGSVSVTCTGTVGETVSYSISLNTGASGNFSNRMLTSGANQLNYNLYTNPSRTLIWGDGTSGTNSISDSYVLNSLSSTKNYSVYGRVVALQNAFVGSYSESLTISLVF